MAFLTHSKIFIYNHRKNPIFNKKRIYMNTNPILNGLDIGIPLNIISDVFTYNHYGYDITNIKVFILQFLIGYYTYGKDRYKDALEYEQFPVETNKQDLYNSILQNKNTYKVSFDTTFYVILAFLFSSIDIYNALPIIFLLCSTEYYKELKQYNAIYKPFYVSLMWTFTTIILPCVIHDQNYEVLYHVDHYISCALLLFASTNLADIKDVNEDKMNEIQTFPVQFGEENTMKIVFACLALSSLLFGINPHYIDRPIINSLFELQNAILSVVSYYVYIVKIRN
uniref:UbiA prenyltransferase family protein n=1 Tax=viral metagenome TaxID=1070528 RepID=A0A6C0KNL6_9ZZZZ